MQNIVLKLGKYFFNWQKYTFKFKIYFNITATASLFHRCVTGNDYLFSE